MFSKLKTKKPEYKSNCEAYTKILIFELEAYAHCTVTQSNYPTSREFSPTCYSINVFALRVKLCR